MGEDYRIHLDVDTSRAKDKLRKVENDRERVDRLVEDTKKNASLSFNQVLSMAQQTWGVVDAMMRAMGINVSMQFRLLMRSGFAAIRVLTPLFTAEALTPGMQAQAALGMLNLILAAEAIKQAQEGETQAATQIAAATEGISGINSMIGSLNF